MKVEAKILRLLAPVCLFLFTKTLTAQELFVYSEPASNMAAKAVGVRATTMPMKNFFSKKTDIYSNLEVMVGVSKNLMLHSEAYFSSIQGNSKFNGAGFYGKYRFYTSDQVHRHFRLAAIGRVTLLNGLPALSPINLTADNSGMEAGLVATQLINKYAFSAGASYQQGWDNGDFKFINANDARHFLAYNIAVGKLMLPKEYVSYDQLNVNLMLEGLGQVNTTTGQQYFDLAPSLQFIIKSKMRVDVGYRLRLSDTYNSVYRQSMLLRFEYNFFNVF